VKSPNLTVLNKRRG